MRAGRKQLRWLPVAVAALGIAAAACTSGSEAEPASSAASDAVPGDVVSETCPVPAVNEFVCNLTDAADAVDELLGGGQEFFEVTSNLQATSVFVALDDATAAQQYIVIDGVAEQLGDRLEGASGNTFTADAVGYDPAAIVDGAREALPTATFIALSVEGGPRGDVRYVMATDTGAISVALDADGRILEAVD